MTNQPTHSPRTPREHAAAILAEPSREQRARMLDAVPAQWRDLVREHVTTAFSKLQTYRQHQADRAGQARQKPPAAPRRHSPLPRISDFKQSVPEVGNARLAELRASLGKKASA
ncbi:hypothetical protein [Stutzerimonas stutzeri]|uniref:hypothetical protein n=1 Tax=Stutzerimonas stutzeri TaxID=316 RepID=UPI002108A819|nr:hypothetical protein [Stutzerimonas stutzeri]MCQ4242398.1 hypothetical protein [Stutzerimonas stutzeri]